MDRARIYNFAKQCHVNLSQVETEDHEEEIEIFA